MDNHIDKIQYQQEEKHWSELVGKAKTSDENAYEQLYLQSSMQLFFFIKKMVKNHSDAMDIMQDCYTAAFQKLDTLKDEEKFLPWLYQIAANRSRNFLKKRKDLFFDVGEDFDETAELEDTSEHFLPESVIENKEKSRLVMEIIDGLPSAQRMCILLYYYSNLSVSTIAETLECPEGTVKSNLNYGRKKIKEEVLMLEKEKDTKIYAALPFWLLLDRYPELAGDAALETAKAEAAWVGISKTLGKGLAKSGITMGSIGIGTKIFSAVIAVLLIGTGIWYFTFHGTEAAFSDSIFEAQLLQELGVSAEDELSSDALDQIYSAAIYNGHIILGDNIYMANDENGTKQLMRGEETIKPEAGETIKEITDLKKLKNLDHLIMIGEIPGTLESIKECENLWSLSVHQADLAQLSTLEASDKVSTILLEDMGAGDYSFVANLKGLTRLNITDCQINDWGFLNAMGSVKQFVLYHDGNLNSLPDMSGMKKLMFLAVSSNRNEFGCVNKIDISGLRQLSKLQVLQLNDMIISDLTPIMSLKSLKSLMIDGEFNTFPSFSALPELELIWVTGIAGSPDLSPFTGLQGLKGVRVNFDVWEQGGNLGEDLSYPEDSQQFDQIFNGTNEELFKIANGGKDF